MPYNRALSHNKTAFRKVRTTRIRINNEQTLHSTTVPQIGGGGDKGDVMIAIVVLCATAQNRRRLLISENTVVSCWLFCCLRLPFQKRQRPAAYAANVGQVETLNRKRSFTTGCVIGCFVKLSVAGLTNKDANGQHDLVIKNRSLQYHSRIVLVHSATLFSARNTTRTKKRILLNKNSDTKRRQTIGRRRKTNLSIKIVAARCLLQRVIFFPDSDRSTIVHSAN